MSHGSSRRITAFLSTPISMDDSGILRPILQFGLLFTIAYFAIFEFHAPRPQILRDLAEFVLVCLSLGTAVVLFLVAGNASARYRKRPFTVACWQMILAFLGIYTLGLCLLYPAKQWLFEIDKPWFWKYYWRHLPYAMMVFSIFLYREYKNSVLNRLAEQLHQRLDVPERAGKASPPPAEEEPLRIQEDGLPGMILPSAITHITVNGHYLDIHHLTDDGPAHACVRKPLGDMLAELPESMFLQVHRSHIVNPAHVTGLVRQGRQHFVRLGRCDATVPVSRNRLQRVIAHLEARFTV